MPGSANEGRMQMRAKVVSVAIDPAALQHGTLTGTGQWQLSIKTNAHALAHTIETKKTGGASSAGSELGCFTINWV